MLGTRRRRTEVFTPLTKSRIAKNVQPPTMTPKTPVYNFTEADKRQLMRDLNSPSASIRVRAISAMKNPKGRYSMFDVKHDDDVQVSQEEQAAALKPKNIQEIMKPVVVYVEVISGQDDCSGGIKRVLKALGATVNERLLKNTTHVIFKNGRLSTYQKARKMNVPIVSILWVEACKQHLIVAHPGDFPITNLERYERPDLYKSIRRPKAMPLKTDAKEAVVNLKTVTRPLNFQTPGAIELRREMEKISAQLRDKMELEKNVQIKQINEVVETPTGPPKAAKCSTESAPKKRISFAPAPEMIALALKNMKALVGSPKELKTPIAEEPEKPQNRRRTLFTPNPAYEVEENVTPKTAIPNSKSRRRTLFTPAPEIELCTPKTTGSTNRRRTLFTPQEVMLQPVTATVKSKPPQKTVRPKPIDDTPRPPVCRPKVSTPQTVIRKRKLETEVMKENTPPRIKPFLTPAIQAFDKIKGIHVDLKVVPPIKRRRTLFAPPADFKL